MEGEPVSAMEELARELAGYVVTRASGPWLQAHGLPTGTLDGDVVAARADLSRRLAAAVRADARALADWMPPVSTWPRHADGTPVELGERAEGPSGAFEVRGVTVEADHAALLDRLGRVALRVRPGERVAREEEDDAD